MSRLPKGEGLSNRDVNLFLVPKEESQSFFSGCVLTRLSGPTVPSPAPSAPRSRKILRKDTIRDIIYENNGALYCIVIGVVVVVVICQLF